MPKEDLLSQEVRQQRRALTLAWSAAASLLILAVAATTAGVFAYRAQQEAIVQRNRAEATLAAATKTANSLVFDLAQRFKNSIGFRPRSSRTFWTAQARCSSSSLIQAK